MIRIIAILVLLFLSSMSYAADKIICTVNDQIITESEFEEFVNVLRFKISVENNDQDKAYSRFLEERSKALDKLIEDRLITEAAQQKGYKIPDDLIESRLQDFRNQFSKEQDFIDTLVAKGINIKTLKQKIITQILMKQIVNDEVRSKINIKPYEVTEFYNEHKEEYKMDSELDYTAIVLKTFESAHDVYNELNKAEIPQVVIDFYSKVSRKGKFSEKGVADNLRVLFDNSDQKLFQPIKVGESYYVFYVTNRYPQRYLQLDEVYSDIVNNLFEKRFVEDFSQWVDSLKEDAVIKIISKD